MQKAGVYFLRAEGQGLIKIGRSVDVQRRLATLRCASPCELTLIAVLSEVDEDEEAALHKRFAHLRRRGEWFAEEAELAEYIKRLPSEQGYEEENEPSTDIETEMITLNDAAEWLGLTRRSLERFEQRGLLDFERVGGRVYVDMDEVMTAKLLTVGRAAKLVGRSWRTAKRWTDQGRLAVHYPAYSNSKGRVSIHEIYMARQKPA